MWPRAPRKIVAPLSSKPSIARTPISASHEYTILTVLRQRVEQLGAEANQCIGEESAILGETEVTTTIDPNLPAKILGVSR